MHQSQLPQAPSLLALPLLGCLQHHRSGLIFALLLLLLLSFDGCRLAASWGG
jgi:hypothetical protein